jgi:lantibiotic biosynthesis protein
MLRAPLMPINQDLNSLHAAAADERVRAALAIANPGVLDALERTAVLEPDSRLARTLHHYLVRIYSRATPFGLFAGAGLIGLGTTTDVALAAGRPTTKTRPDMKWLNELVNTLEKDIEVRHELSYRANPAVFERAGRLFALSGGDDTEPGWSTISVRATRVTRQVIRLARNGIAHRELVDRLATESGASTQKAERLVDQLWSQQLLRTDLHPPLTDGDPAAYVRDRLAHIPAAAVTYATLRSLLSAMAAFDAGSRGTLDDYQALRSAAEPLGMDLSKDPPQVDMALSLSGSQLSDKVAAEAARAAQVLLDLSTPPLQSHQIEAYLDRFVSTYGYGRRVPLLELLDQHFGLGSPYVTLDGHFEDTQRDRILTKIALNALAENKSEVELDAETLTRLRTRSSADDDPPSLDVVVSVLAESAADLDEGRFTLVVGANLGSNVAGRNLGRFAHLLGEPAIDALAQTSEPSRPGTVSAELVYTPADPRWANLAVRPHCSDYEIVVAATPGVPSERVIPVDELVVEAFEDRFRISWSRGDAEVRVTAGHMVNESKAPDVVRFLMDTRPDARRPYQSFDWGEAAQLPALPRVRAGRTVLCPGRFPSTDLIGPAGRAPAEFASAVAGWQHRWSVPRHVHVSTGDHRLLIDLETEFGRNGLRLELRRFTEHEAPSIEEALSTADQAWLTGPGGRYVAEVVVPLLRATEPSPTASKAFPAVPRVRVADRLRAPGSDWLYCKLYCPVNAEEDVLLDTVASLCDPLATADLIEDWFFVRYSDPEPHLRLRFRGEPEVLLITVMPRLCAWNQQLINRDLCFTAAIDTYDREIERYKSIAGMGYSERVFGADSRAVAKLLALRRAGIIDLDPVVLAATSIRDLLELAGYDHAEQLRWITSIVGRIPSPHPGPRNEVRQLRAVLCSGPSAFTAFKGGAEVAAVFDGRRRELPGLADRVDEITQGTPAVRDDLLHSYIHMHCNRLLGRDRTREAKSLIVLQKTLYGLAASAHARLRTV